MRNLARHIENLLHDNDCVILPGFGGFITHSVPAFYISQEKTYYPPSRSINFNAALTMNDGVLAQSYMRTYNVDFSQATYLIDIAIEKIREELDEVGYVTFPHIGVIKQDIHQTIQFIAEPAGLSSPAHFGLSSFPISTLSHLEALSSQDSQEAKPIITQSTKTINVHIQKKTLRQVLSTAAIFLLLLLVSIPTGNQESIDIASLQFSDLIYDSETNDISNYLEIEINNKPSANISLIDSTSITDANAMDNSSNTIYDFSPAAIEEEPITQEEHSINDDKTYHTKLLPPMISDNTNESEIIKQTEPQPTTESISSAKKSYHIIVESLPNHRGVEEVLNKYINKGYLQASIIERDNRVRISIANFTDKNEANSYLKSLREIDSFQNAWLLPIHN